ncbi:DUF2062 domain-containing protein [Thermodesulfobacteriota bacterium]
MIRILKKVYERFLKIRGDSKKIALGFALGLFLGVSPSMGFQIGIAVFLAAILKWNKISAAVGVWITNPITAPFIYGLTYLIGARLLRIKKTFNPEQELNLEMISSMLSKTPEVIWALVLGGIILGLPVAVAGYIFSYSAITKYRKNIKEKILAKREKLRLKNKKIKKPLRYKKIRYKKKIKDKVKISN